MSPASIPRVGLGAGGIGGLGQGATAAAAEVTTLESAAATAAAEVAVLNQQTQAAGSALGSASDAATLVQTKFAGLAKTAAGTLNPALAGSATELGSVTTALKGLGSAGPAAAAALAVIAVGILAFKGVHELADLAAEIRKIKSVSGATAEEASKLNALFKVTGVNAQTGARALLTLNHNINANAAALEADGIRIAKNSKGQTDLAATLLNVADAYKAVGGGTAGATIAQDAFGTKGALVLIPLLAKSREELEKFIEEAKKHGQFLTDADLQKAIDYKLALFDLGEAVKGLELKLGEGLVPVLIKVAHWLTTVVELADRAAHIVNPRIPGTDSSAAGFAGAGARDIPLVGQGVAATIDLLSGHFKSAALDAIPLSNTVRALFGHHKKAAEAAKEQADATADLGNKVVDTRTDIEKLNDVLAKTAAALDFSFGRFVDAETASNALKDAVFSLGEELGKGREKGESLDSFNRKLAESTLDVVAKVEAYTAAEQKAGTIGEGAAAAQAEIRKQLILISAQFPELKSHLQTYIDLLGGIPSSVTTHVRLDTSQADAALTRFKNNIDALHGIDNPLTSAPAPVIDVGQAEKDGRAAGAAAAKAAADEIKVTLRRSSTTGGLDIGGFILSGINLGPALAEVNAANMRLAASTGKVAEVIAASKFDPAEQLAILNAVKAVDQAVLDLNEATKTYGADSIEAAVATQELAAKRATLNQTILDGIDATKAINDLLAEEKKKMNELTASVSAASGALSALRQIEDARDAAAKARKAAATETERLGQFDQRITEAKAELRRIRSEGGAGSEDEARALATLHDLEQRRKGQVEKVSDANQAAVDANLALVEATLGLASAGLALQNQLPGWQAFFVGVAKAAGLSMASIWTLVAALNTAADAAQRARALVAGAAAPAQLASPSPATTRATDPGRLTAQSTNRAGVNVEQINIVEAQSARATAIEVVDELKATALLGA